MDELLKKDNKTIPEKDFLKYYEDLKPVGDNPCTINRISWLFENKFNGFLRSYVQSKEFDYEILKSGVEYSKSDYSRIKKIKTEYDEVLQYYQRLVNIRVLYIDGESENILFVPDFRKLGNEWRLYKGEKYIRCADCGMLVRKTKGTTKYCKNCKKENELERYKRYNEKRKLTTITT